MKLGELLSNVNKEKLPGKLFYHGLPGDYWLSDDKIWFTGTDGKAADRMFTLSDFQRDDWCITYR